MRLLSLVLLVSAAICASTVWAQERPYIKLMHADLPLKASEAASNCFLSRYGSKLGSDAWWKDAVEARNAVANLNLCEMAARSVGVALQDAVKLMKADVPTSKWVACFEQEAKRMRDDPDDYMARSLASSAVVKEQRTVMMSELAYFEMKRHASTACDAFKD